ncbi:MAG: hypothetical protein P8Z68_04105 [Kineosporiaceae bacterium]
MPSRSSRQRTEEDLLPHRTDRPPGLLLTVVTYAIAPPGGVFMVAWGPALVGAIQIVKGLTLLAR